jgi:Flp pilus assembly protein TadG
MKARASNPTRRRGTFIPILAICTVGLFAFISLAIDLGMLAVVRTQCQQAADAAALTGARLLNNKTGAANNNFANAKTGAETVIGSNSFLQQNFASAERTVTVGQYTYDTGAGRFIANSSSFTGTAGPAPAGTVWTAMRSSITVNQNTFFAKFGGGGFGGIFNYSNLTNGADAIAVHRPRDIAIVLDYTGSMGFDSYPYFTDADSQRYMNNPDPQYPKFGHYGRYTYYATTGTTANNSNPTARANPMRRTDGGAGNRYPPSNYTTDTQAGPTICADWLTAPGDPASVTINTTVDYPFQWWAVAATGKPTSVPPITTRANTTVTPPTPTLYNWSNYPPTQAVPNLTKAIPAPPNYEDQSEPGGYPLYLGDKWPRTTGARGPATVAGSYPTTGTSVAWATLSGSTYTDLAAKTLTEYLGGLYALTTTAGRDLTGWTFPSQASEPAYGDPVAKFGATGTQRIDGGENSGRYRDAVWENYGYDIDMVDLRGQAGPIRTVALRAAADRFKGYAMGPGYWGRTFFIWPPDPRWGNPDGGAPLGGAILPHSPSATDPRKDTNGNWICDWRKRFFVRGDSTDTTDVLFTEGDNINNILFRSAAGATFQTPATAAVIAGITSEAQRQNTQGYYRINYRAVIAWLKSAALPRVLPTNLRAGRIVYYATMPDNLYQTSTGDTNDKAFLRNYIHFVLGIPQFNAAQAPVNANFAETNRVSGVETRYPFGTMTINAGTPANTPTVFDPNGTADPAPNPRPYMNYTDNINRPRSQFWFGPYTLTAMLNMNGQSGLVSPGLREGARWQLGASINSVLDDIRNNHPNDFCGITGYATRNYSNSDYDIPMAPMGQDWFTLKNSLFFRRQTVATLKGTPTSGVENRVFNTDMSTNSSIMQSLPVASGGTDPVTGMAVAFNMLSSADTTSLPISRNSGGVTVLAYGDPAATPAYRGRRGASKIVVFETDGEPNQNATWSLTGTGVNTRYQSSGSSETWSVDGSVPSQGGLAIAVVKRIVASTTATTPGYSLPNSPARVYSIGFGAIFDGWPNHGSMSSSGQTAHRFLLRVQQLGNTSSRPVNESDLTQTGFSPPAMLLPNDQIIVGPYQRPDPTVPVSASNPAGRIEKLRTCLERIFQSGVQVTLIE